MLENICATGQCSDTSVKVPLLESELLFAQLIHFSFCYNLILTVSSPREAERSCCSR